MAHHMITISTPDAPPPRGHYSQAVVHGGAVYVSGQLPLDPHTGEMRLGPIEEQTEQVLKNLAAILEAAGSGIEELLKVTIYVSDMSLWDGVNAVYARFLGEHRPARSVVPTRELHRGVKLELDAIAATKG